MTTQPAPPQFVWDDQLWSLVWERHLGPVERHAIGMDVIRRRMPAEIFEARVATELARQWRRRARNLAFVYTAWTVFWLMLTWGAWTRRGQLEALQFGCALVGLMAVGACIAWRRYLREYAQQHP